MRTSTDSTRTRLSVGRLRTVVAIFLSVLLLGAGASPASAGTPGSISGTITVSGGGPASGGCVYLYTSAWGYAASQCVDGSYTFSDLLPGDYYARFTNYAGAVSEWFPGVVREVDATLVTVSAGATTTANMVLDGDARVQATVTMTGGALAFGGCIDAYSSVGYWLAEGCADIPGHVTIDHLPAGMTVRLNYLSFTGARNTWSGGVEFQADATTVALGSVGSDTPVSQELAVEAVLAGTVTFQNGTPVAGAGAAIYTLDGLLASVNYDGTPEGAYSVGHLWPGQTYIIQLRDPNTSLTRWYNGTDNYADAAPVRIPGLARTLNMVWEGAALFPDVPPGAMFQADIEWMSNLAISTGYVDGGFHPAANVSRQAMAAFMYRFAGSPAFTPPVTSPFNDVATDSPFYAEVCWMADQGISTGYADGGFHPMANVSRQAMAAFMYRFAGNPAFTPPVLSPFNDVATDSAFYAEVTWMADAAISTGYGDGGFHPIANVSRQAMAAFMHRLDGVLTPV